MCLTPLPLKSGHVVQCGRCSACRLSRSQQWIFRLSQEHKRHATALFVTLTYSDVPRTSNGFGTLDKRDLQLYFKTLRNDHVAKYGSSPVIKYYACGEYGGRTLRPHYHVILFGADVSLVSDAWRCADGALRGHTHIGDVTSNSISYTTKYICKPRRNKIHSRDDRLPEFSLMSKRMGDNYLTPAIVRYHHADLSRNYVVEPGGVKVPMPRYYKAKLFSAEQTTIVGELMKAFSDGKFAADRAKHALSFGSDVGFEVARDARIQARLSRDFSLIQKNRLTV